MHPKLQEQLDAMEIKLNQIEKTTKQTHRYLLITVWSTVAVIVLPMIGLLFAIPAFLRSIEETMSIIQY